MSAYGLGLDLGMTTISAAVALGGDVEVVPAGADDTTASPALIYAAHGHVATGAAAAVRAIASPDRLAIGILARVGDPDPVVIGDHVERADSLITTMIGAVVTGVARRHGQHPARLTVTHPAHWPPSQINALGAALRPVLPGHRTRQLIPSVVAAGYDYALTHQLPDGAAVIVVDMGATAFEVAVVARRGRTVDLVGPVARGPVGGDNCDDVVVDFVDREAGRAVTALDPSTLQTRITMARLRRDCRRAKEVLSTADHVDIPAHLPAGTITVRLTRTTFEAVVRERLDPVIDAVVRAVRTNHAAHLQALLLTGGATQTPLLRRQITGIDGAPPVQTVRYAAARGAAWLAAPPPATAVPADRGAPSPAGADLPRGDRGDSPIPAAAGSGTGTGTGTAVLGDLAAATGHTDQADGGLLAPPSAAAPITASIFVGHAAPAAGESVTADDLDRRPFSAAEESGSPSRRGLAIAVAVAAVVLLVLLVVVVYLLSGRALAASSLVTAPAAPAARDLAVLSSTG